MKWLIWSIRTWFCKHEWGYEERDVEFRDGLGRFCGENTQISATCKHCGWHRKYKKF